MMSLKRLPGMRAMTGVKERRGRTRRNVWIWDFYCTNVYVMIVMICV